MNHECCKGMSCFFGFAISGLTLAILVTRFAFGKNLTYRLTFWLCPLVALVGVDSYVLGKFTIYNLTADLICVLFGTIVILGSFYVIGNFLIRKLQIISDSVSESAREMLSASSNVSENSQTLAENTSTQAAAIEETSSSLEEMSAMTKQSVGNTDEAKALTEKTKSIISNVEGHMSDMAQAMHEISETSDETAKIIKTIDGIAFQTNLLALNAAVEAARAGEAGAGFAVVAEEVRSLARRAANAARDTNQLIQNIVSVVRKGNELTSLTQNAFVENVAITEKISVLVDDIAAAAKEQEDRINHIHKAVAELDRTSQINAGTSEESAAAAQEMSAQSRATQEAVHTLLILIHGRLTPGYKDQ